MIERRTKCHHTELEERLLPDLLGRVFHLTTLTAYPKIIETGTIDPNRDGAFGSTFPQSDISYFRHRGCVCVFDLRATPSDKLTEGLEKYYFLNPTFAQNYPVFLFLSPACHHRLIDWSEWKKAEAWNEMVVPHIEAGFPGPIEVNLIEEALLVEIEKPPGKWEQIPHAAQHSAG